MIALDRHRALLAVRSSSIRTIENAGLHDNYTDAHRARVRLAEIDEEFIRSHPLLLDLWAAALDVMRDCHPSLESSCAPDVYAAFRGSLAKLEAMQ